MLQILPYVCVDGWSSPLKQSIYSFVILLPDRKQYIYSIEDYSSHSHASNFNAEKIIHILEQVGPEKFTAIVTDAEAAMMAAKRIVTSTFPNILSIRCIAHHIQLIASDIVKVDWAKNTLQNIQKIITFFQNNYQAGSALRDDIIESLITGGYLKTTVKTRWSTAWDACESMIRLESSIKSVLEAEPEIFRNAVNVRSLIHNRQFWMDVNQLHAVLSPIKKAVKDVEFTSTTMADVFMELVKLAISIKEIPTLINNNPFKQECHGIFNKRWKQFDTDIYILAFSYTQNIVFEIYKNTIKTALTLWKQFGGGATKPPFQERFVESVDNVQNWWNSCELRRNEDFIRVLALKLAAITPHNGACEHIFSILSWYTGKRRTK
ncbi:18588_t:CDS:2 [Entrophospora sp. SA101]|nr:18588_t:CDS:2 [Entrophospora sp. SA101]